MVTKKKSDGVSKSQAAIIHKLAENSVELQKKNAETIQSINKLVTRIDKLVSLFEEASKHVAEVSVDDDRIKLLAAKLETLLEQNKDIAKGLILLEKYVRGRTGFEPSGMNTGSTSSTGYRSNF